MCNNLILNAMKKRYMNPSIDVVDFEKLDIVTTSLRGGGDNDGDGAPVKARSQQRRGIWDE